MARYIDADKLIAHLEDEIRECKPPQGGRAGGKSIAYGTMLGLKSAIAFADALAADVAPRSEVEALEKEIDRLKKILDYYALQYGTVKSQQQVIDRAKSEVAREIFAEIEKIINENYDKAQDNEEDEALEAATDYLSYVSCDLDDFKQKYTGEQK